MRAVFNRVSRFVLAEGPAGCHRLLSVSTSTQFRAQCCSAGQAAPLSFRSGDSQCKCACLLNKHVDWAEGSASNLVQAVVSLVIPSKLALLCSPWGNLQGTISRVLLGSLE